MSDCVDHQFFVRLFRKWVFSIFWLYFGVLRILARTLVWSSWRLSKYSIFIPAFRSRLRCNCFGRLVKIMTQIICFFPTSRRNQIVWPLPSLTRRPDWILGLLDNIFVWRIIDPQISLPAFMVFFATNGFGRLRLRVIWYFGSIFGVTSLACAHLT